ncbi:MAG: (2Fe-2S)-binding protein [Alphaproteobacteria bacterium]|jgi:nicotinate dehydrogenase subunit A
MTETFELTVNGAAYEITARPDLPLIYVLRNQLGLTGTHYGCGLEQCGACMVLVDGEAVYACTRTMDSVANKSVQTMEGLGTREDPHPLQQAFMDEQAGQCGYCLSGILISAKALLDSNPNPSRSEIATALDGNLCRCGAHTRIIRAIERAART